MTIQIRMAQIEDIDLLLPMVRDFVTSFEIDKSAYENSFTKLLRNKDALILLAEADNFVVGYSLGFCHDTFYANGKVAWLEEIMVALPQRRQGIGELMVTGFEQWAKTQGCTLSALATRRASSFYLALGYEDSATYFRKVL